MPEMLDQLKDEGLQPDYLRIRALPFHPQVRAFIESQERVYILEQNRDGQMLRLLAAEYPDLAPKLRSITHYDGTFIDALSLSKAVLHHEKPVHAEAAAHV